jgi:hypothetical protein
MRRFWRESGSVNRWGICTEYELVPSPRGGLDEYYQTQRRPSEYHLSAKHPHPLTDTVHWTLYKPLDKYPDLFLRFARLTKAPASPQRALNWCLTYGVLGLENDYHRGWSGGPKENLEAFDTEVIRATGVLALYEAALNEDYEAAKHLVLNEYPHISAELWGLDIEEVGITASISEMVEVHSGGDYLAYALEAASWIVEETVRGSCFPSLRPEGGRNPYELRGGWGFRNLRGAMYLQMYWLMEMGGNVVPCRWCGAIVSLSPPSPGTRKPPQHKQFCDDACRQRDYYHNTVKPRRQRNKA